MRPKCPYCLKATPVRVPLTTTSQGTLIDWCCRRCEAEWQAEDLLWRNGTGLGRTP